MDVNNDLKICFMRKVTHLLALKNTHNVFRWVTLNVNITFVYEKTPQGASNIQVFFFFAAFATICQFVEERDCWH